MCQFSVSREQTALMERLRRDSLGLITSNLFCWKLLLSASASSPARSQCKSHTRSLAPELPSQKESPVCKVLGARTRRAFNRLKPHVPISTKRRAPALREREEIAKGVFRSIHDFLWLPILSR